MTTSFLPSRIWRLIVLIVTLAIVGVLAAAPDAGAERARFTVDWSACDGAPAAQCGTLTVPIDWSKQRGPTVDLAVARRTATDPAQRVGTLFFNPGGPGDGAVEYVKAAEAFFTPTMLARFDLVGMDPRGMLASTQIQCSIPVITADLTLFPRTEQEFQRLRQRGREVGETCLREVGPLMRHMDTLNVARDHEALRLALKVEQVNWLGLSYGTQLAADYAQLFGRRTRAMVLDAALEHSLAEVHQVAGEAMAAEDSFNRFADWCPTADSCALRGQDVRTVFDRLVADANRQPIPVPGAVRPVTGDDIRMGTKGLLRFKEPSVYGPDLSWAGLSRALQRALEGDASAFIVAPEGAPQYGLHSLLANACLDYAPQVDSYAEMQQRLELGRQVAPHLQGASETWQALLCIDWPIKPTNPPTELSVRRVPALVVQAAHDPSIAYSWSHGLAAQIEGSATVTRTGDGHTSLYTSECVRAAMDAFLIAGRAGTPNQVCEG